MAGAGFVVMTTWLLAVLGGRSRRAPAESVHPTGSIEVMGDVLVVKKVDMIVEAIGQNTYFLGESKVAIQANTSMHGRFHDEVQAFRQVVDVQSRKTDGLIKLLEELLRETAALRNETRELRDENRGLREEMLRGGRPR